MVKRKKKRQHQQRQTRPELALIRPVPYDEVSHIIGTLNAISSRVDDIWDLLQKTSYADTADDG